MFYHLVQKDSPGQAMLRGGCTEVMTERLKNNSQLLEKLIPSWGAGCRRLSPSDTYLEALQSPNTTPCFTPISRITSTGITTTDGKGEDFDLIVCATGFDTSRLPQWHMRGEAGVDIREVWTGDPEAFLGLSVQGMPNYLVFFGPGSPIANGSSTRASGWICDFAIRMIEKISREDIKCVPLHLLCRASENLTVAYQVYDCQT